MAFSASTFETAVIDPTGASKTEGRCPFGISCAMKRVGICRSELSSRSKVRRCCCGMWSASFNVAGPRIQSVVAPDKTRMPSGRGAMPRYWISTPAAFARSTLNGASRSRVAIRFLVAAETLVLIHSDSFFVGKVSGDCGSESRVCSCRYIPRSLMVLFMVSLS